MKSFTELTSVPHEVTKKAIRWLSRQHEEVFVEIFKKQKHHFYRLKSKDTGNDLLRLSSVAFIISVVEAYRDYLQYTTKNRTADLSHMKQSSRIRAKVLKKQCSSPKLEKLLLRKNLLLQLIESEGLSFREVSKYLNRYHRFKVSQTLVGKAYKLLKKGENNV